MSDKARLDLELLFDLLTDELSDDVDVAIDLGRMKLEVIDNRFRRSWVLWFMVMVEEPLPQSLT